MKILPLLWGNKVYLIYKIAFTVTALLLLSASPVRAGLETLPPFIKLQPYKVKEQELDLWRIEANHFKRSRPALAPDGSGMAYSEAIYEPGARQLFSALYWVPFEGLPQWNPEAPTKDPNNANPKLWLSFLDPNQSLQLRTQLGQTGNDTRRTFGFQTLTVVDWSADSQNLLLKRRVGLMYTGLRTSETLVFSKETGELSNYRELQRAVHYYWAKQLQDDTLPLFQYAWQIEPLGWEVGSSHRFYFEGWAYHQNERKEYLGLWLYDLKQQRPKLLSPTPKQMPLAYNAQIALLEVEELSEPYKSQWQPQGSGEGEKAGAPIKKAWRPFGFLGGGLGGFSTNTNAQSKPLTKPLSKLLRLKTTVPTEVPQQERETLKQELVDIKPVAPPPITKLIKQPWWQRWRNKANATL